MSDLASFVDVTAVDSRVHQQGYGVVSFGRPDDQQYVRFYQHTVQNGIKSLEANRPVHELLDYVEIGSPGAKNRWAGQATEEHKKRFPKHWANYLENRQNPALVGTPLEHCTFLDRATCEDLRALKVFTAEQLASLDDAACSRIGPTGRGWKAQAEAFLKSATDTSFATKMAAENAEMKAELQVLREEISNLRGSVARGEPATGAATTVTSAPAAIDYDLLASKVAALQPKPPKRGRRPKNPVQ